MPPQPIEARVESPLSVRPIRPRNRQKHMNKAQRNSPNRLQRRHVSSHMDGRVRFLLSGEEHLLSAIASRASLRGILNGICSALNFQIGNVVSLIARSGNDGWDVGESALKAALCGLYMLSSESILAEDGEVLGNLKCMAGFRENPLPTNLN